MSPVETRRRHGRRRSNSSALVPSILVPLRITASAALVVLATSGPAVASQILLHIAPRTPQAGCDAGEIGDPAQAVTSAGLSTGPGSFYNVYVLAVKGAIASLAAVEIGIRYQNDAAGGLHDGVGVDVLGWTLCADSETHGATWPASHSSNRIVWNSAENCQDGTLAVAGYFYVGAYSADALSLTGVTGSTGGAMADCAAQVHPVEPANLGVASFSPGAQQPGCNPLLANCVTTTAVAPVSWTRIKSLAIGPRTR